MKSLTYYQRNKKRILAYQKEYQKKRWEEDPRHMRAIKIKCVYGLSKQDYDTLIASHGGKCAICKKDAKLHIDHDHKTNKVRGLLCAKCNKAIGLLDDDPIITAMAVKYLQENK